MQLMPEGHLRVDRKRNAELRFPKTVANDQLNTRNSSYKKAVRNGRKREKEKIMAVCLSKLGTVLTAVFLFLLLALAAELFYLLWWRRRSFRRNNATASEISGNPSAICFLCWKSQSRSSRIEPAGASPAPEIMIAGAEESDGVEAKWTMCLQGPSRVLFTIKEEREETPSPSVATDDCEIGLRESTPFSTPEGSPAFYTPSSSPPREGFNVSGNLTFPMSNDDFSVENGEVCYDSLSSVDGERL